MRVYSALRWAAFFALAVFAFAGIACSGTGSDGNISNDPPLSGDVKFEFDIDGEILAGTELEVSYSGDEKVTFQWHKDGEPIPGETDSTFTPDEAGVYTVTVIAEGHAPKTSDPITVTGPPAPVVTFDKNNTDEGSIEAYPHYKAVGRLTGTVAALPTTEPTRIGYTFAGWNMAANGSGEAFTTATVVTASITVYAQWTTITYAVVYDGNGHTDGSVASTVHTYGVPASLTANGFWRDDHVFIGWNTRADGSGTSYADGATVVNLRSTQGDTITLYAQWATQYVIFYEGNGHTDGSVVETFHAWGVPASLAANDFTRCDNVFVGWNTRADGSGTHYADGATVVNLSAKPGDSIILYAQWEMRYTVIYHGNRHTGGSTAGTLHVLGVPASLAANGFTRTGHIFTGWNTAANGTGTHYADGAMVVNLSLTADAVTLFAQWLPISYTVVYDGNGHTGGSVASTAHTYGVPANLSWGGFALPWHFSSGWNTQANGRGTRYNAGAPVVNLRDTPGTVTLFAQWVPVTITIEYMGNGHTCGGWTEDTRYTYGANDELRGNNFERTGHVFVGWNTRADGSGTQYDAEVPVWLNFDELSISEDGYVTLFAQWVIPPDITSTLPGGVPLDMRWIPAGTFQMGQSGVETPVHSVTLTRGFFMGMYPVTQEQYRAVMTGNANGLNASPSSFSGSPAAGEVQARRPVERVSWYDAIVFCNRLSIQQGLNPVYSINGSTNPATWGNVPASSNATWNAVTANWNANGYRLPTEAEWEYACRAGTTTLWYTGNTVNAALQAAAWYSMNSGGRTRQVGLKTPNAWGLYDMHGNVWEWCWDWLAAYTAAAKTDPRGPASGPVGPYRAFRGGSWRNDAGDLRSAYRGLVDAPSSWGDVGGFRVVRYQ